MKRKVDADKIYERLQNAGVNFARLPRYTRITRQGMQHGLQHSPDPLPYLANLKDGLLLMGAEMRSIIRLIDDEIKQLKAIK